MGAIKRIKTIAKFAKEKQEKTIKKNPKLLGSLIYRWEHTLRVAQYGKILAEKEEANIEIVLVACLLHDIAKLSHRSDTVEHGRIGAKIARPFLRKLGYAQADVKNICFSISNHVDGKADFEHPLTLEAQIVNDADKIDRFSSYRILQSMDKSIGNDYDNFISCVEDQLERLDRELKIALVYSKSGKKAFDQQIALQRSYLERLIADHKMTSLPEF